MGPVESWLRFGGFVVVGVSMIGLFGWWVLEMDGPLWAIGALSLAVGAMIVVSYERMIGW